MQQNELNILQWNAGGLSNSKMTEIKQTVQEEDIDVLIINEANVTDANKKFYNIKGYTTYALFKNRQVASGILAAVKTKLTTRFQKIKEMQETDTSEIIEITVWTDKNKIKIYGIYSPPNNKNLNLDILNITNNTIIVGDLNAASPAWGYNYKNRVGKLVEDYINSNSLKVLYDPEQPKSFIHHSGSTTNPDIVIVSTHIVDQCKKKLIGDPGCGHRMIKTSLKLERGKPNIGNQIRWNLKKANWHAFKQKVEELLEDINTDSPYAAVSKFNEALKKSARATIPRGRMKRYSPFWTKELTELRKRRDIAREKAEKTEEKTELEIKQDVMNWKKECAILKKQIIISKRKRWNEFINNMDYRTDGNKAHKLFNTLNNKHQEHQNQPMMINGKEVIDKRKIASKFNSHFLSSPSSRTKPTRKQKASKKLENIAEGDKFLNTLFTKEFSNEELQEAIKNTKSNKQPGADKIFPEFIKNLGPKAKMTLLNIYNTFWTEKMNLPTDWTKATVIPILKPGKQANQLEAYRPIALTSIVAKVFERMITTRLKWFLENQNILAEEQAGFRDNMSTGNSLMNFVQEVKQNFNKKESTLAVFIDFKGAYDTVWRSHLINKLKRYGVKRNMLSWLTRFLTQRWMQTQWAGVKSKYKQSKIGLPQGAVSSPTLFNIYINDLVKALKSIPGIKVNMFADDVVVWCSAKHNKKHKEILEKTMNESLNTLKKWATDNNMTISAEKTKYQYFSLRHNSENFRLQIDHKEIEKSSNTKYLGVTLDNKLSWSNHIKNTVERANKRLGLIKRLAGATWGNTQDTLNITYNTYVKPVMRYGSEVLITANKTRLEELEKTQNNALRLISGAVKSTPVAALQEYTGNLPISVEIQKQATNSYIKMKASQRANWIKQHNSQQNLKTQTTPIDSCHNFLKYLNIPTQTENISPPINPLDFRTIQINMSLTEEMKKKDTSPEILKQSTLETINTSYPEEEWLRIYTDGSQMDTTNTTGAGVYCKLFSQYASVGTNTTNFDGEIEAVFLALQQLLYRIDAFRKVVFLVDSKAAIQAISSNRQTRTTKIHNIKQMLKHLQALQKTIVFQWVPSHVGLQGNELADILAKKGTKLHTSANPLQISTMQMLVSKTTGKIHRQEISIQSKNKKWENIHKHWEVCKNKPRKEAVSHFRLKTGHDCLAAHLTKIGIYQSEECTICHTKDSIMNEEHLLCCPKLDKTQQKLQNISKLYWDARTRMMR